MLHSLLKLIDSAGEILILYQAEMINLMVIFLLNVVSTTLGNLKTILLAKRVMRMVYATTFIDAMVFAVTFKFIASFSNAYCVLVFAAGRLCGVYLGHYIEERLAFGMVEVEVHKHPEEGIALADQLRSLGYSVITYKGYGVNGKERLVISIVIPRRNLPELKNIMGKGNIAIRDISKTYGKIGRIQTN